jgi:hypothetical protein
MASSVIHEEAPIKEAGSEASDDDSTGKIKPQKKTKTKTKLKLPAAAATEASAPP